MSDLQRDEAIHLARERSFRLGPVEVRPSTREVVGPRGRAVLEPRVMQVLVALARARGEVVTRDDLTQSCWDGRIVGEDAISRVISHLRRVSEGVGQDGWRLETVTKVGYRLVAADQAADPAAAPPSEAPPPDAPPRRDRRGLLVLAGGIVVAAAGGGLVWRLRQPRIPDSARELYERGREALKPGLPEDVEQGLGFLREAVAQAPDYADAWGALALAYQNSLLFTPPPRQAGVKSLAEAAARRALELDPDQAQASAAIALLAPTFRNWIATEKLYIRALDLHPRDPQVELHYARLCMEVGRMKAAVEHGTIAVASDPFVVWAQHALALALWSAGRVEEAEQILVKGLARWPRHYALWFAQLSLLAFTGRPDRALAHGEDLSGRPYNTPAEDIEISIKGVRALKTQAPADIAAAVEANLEAARRGVGYAENAMGWLSTLGRLDESFAVARALFLGEGYTPGEARFSSGRFAVGGQRHTYPLFMPQTRPMRADQRFGPLIRDIGIADYWRASGHGPDDPALARAASA